MKTLQELLDEYAELKSKIKEVGEAIDCHPDSIKSYFNHIDMFPELEAFIDTIEMIDSISGTLDIRKNPMKYSGYKMRFKGDPVNYFAIDAHSWCSGFRAHGILWEREYQEDIDPDDIIGEFVPYDYWDRDGIIQSKFSELLGGHHAVVVGTLLAEF